MDLDCRQSLRAAATAPFNQAAADPHALRGAARVERPWGWYEELGRGDQYLVKRLWIAPGCRISLQRHQHRSEHWVVVSGGGLLENDGQESVATAGSSLWVAQGAIHRATAGAEGLAIIEVQRGSLLEETDIERFADDFGRAPS
jgi:mannose-6-phosphate isomerase